MKSSIRSVHARQIFSQRGHPGVESTVVTENGAVGVAVATSGKSAGKHEVKFLYDGGDRWDGMGVQRAVENVNNIIAPLLKGMNAGNQREVDQAMIDLDGSVEKSKLGGNATASVSAAVLKVGAASLGIPLYQHIGGVNSNILPVPGVMVSMGGNRYGGGYRSGGKPSYSLMCFGFKNFSEASYACWEVSKKYRAMIGRRGRQRYSHDREIWNLMEKAIEEVGYKNRVGIQVDVAAGTYFDPSKELFKGLFSKEDKTKEELMDLYKDMANNYPFVIIEDPLDEDDYEGHAVLTKELSLQVVGDDLFTTNLERIRIGIKVGACNAILLKVNQIGTVSEAFNAVQLAMLNNYGVMPCSSRGEGADIADYTVGLGTGQMREGGTGATANRLMQIEAELGKNARFLGKEALKK